MNLRRSHIGLLFLAFAFSLSLSFGFACGRGAPKFLESVGTFGDDGGPSDGPTDDTGDVDTGVIGPVGGDPIIGRDRPIGGDPRGDDGGPGEAGPPDNGTGACRGDCECASESACIRGVCTAAGRSNQCCSRPFCPPGARCIDETGSPSFCPIGADAGAPPDPDAGPPLDAGSFPDAGGPQETPVGAECGGASVDECGPSGICADEQAGFPGGYCTEACGMSNGPCPPGAVCRGVGGGQAYCFDACQQSAECRTGYNCVQFGIGQQRVCWPAPPGSMNPNGTPVGSSCGGAEDCDSGLNCFEAPGPSFPGGYCTLLYCDPVTNPCPGGSECYAFPGITLCLEDCPSAGSRSTCRQGYYCLGPTGSSGVCVSN